MAGILKGESFCLVFLSRGRRIFLRGDPKAVEEGKEKRERDSLSLGCYGGKA